MPRNPTFPIVYHPDSEMDIGDHIFATEKYRLALGLLHSAGLAGEGAVRNSEPASDAEILLVHTPEYLRDLTELRISTRTVYSELPLNHGIVEGFRIMAGGTILTARLALEHGPAMHLGGGFHHAYADHAEGFCYLNDIAIAIRVLQNEGRIARAAVVDLDLHQGNGTAHIFQEDPDVFTFSMHQEMLYPEKERSTLDIGLRNYVGDAEYLSELAGVIPSWLVDCQPDLVIYVAGADPFHDDQLGDLKLTFDGLKRRDQMVAEACRENGWPMAAVTAGGYARKATDTARIHANTAIEMARAWGVLS